MPVACIGPTGDYRPRPPQSDGSQRRDRQQRPAAETGSRDRQPRPAAETGSRDRQPRPAAKTGSRDRQPRPAAETGGRDRRQRPAAEAGSRGRQQRPAAETGGRDRRQRPAAETGGRDRQQRPAAETGSRDRQQPSQGASRNTSRNCSRRLVPNQYPSSCAGRKRVCASTRSVYLYTQSRGHAVTRFLRENRKQKHNKLTEMKPKQILRYQRQITKSIRRFKQSNRTYLNETLNIHIRS